MMWQISLGIGLSLLMVAGLLYKTNASLREDLVAQMIVSQELQLSVNDRDAEIVGLHEDARLHDEAMASLRVVADDADSLRDSLREALATNTALMQDGGTTATALEVLRRYCKQPSGGK